MIGTTLEFSLFVQGNGQIWNGRGRVPQGSTLIFSATVIGETAKAVQLKSTENNRVGWAPKSAITNGTLADWIAVKLAREAGFAAHTAIDCL